MLLKIFIFLLRLSPRGIWGIFKFDFCYLYFFTSILDVLEKQKLNIILYLRSRNYQSLNYQLSVIVWYVVGDVSGWWYVWGIVTHWTRDRAGGAQERTEAARVHWEDFTLYTLHSSLYNLHSSQTSGFKLRVSSLQRPEQQHHHWFVWIWIISQPTFGTSECLDPVKKIWICLECRMTISLNV